MKDTKVQDIQTIQALAKFDGNRPPSAAAIQAAANGVLAAAAGDAVMEHHAGGGASVSAAVVCKTVGDRVYIHFQGIDVKVNFDPESAARFGADLTKNAAQARRNRQSKQDKRPHLPGSLANVKSVISSPRSQSKRKR